VKETPIGQEYSKVESQFLISKPALISPRVSSGIELCDISFDMGRLRMSLHAWTILSFKCFASGPGLWGNSAARFIPPLFLSHRTDPIPSVSSVPGSVFPAPLRPLTSAVRSRIPRAAASTPLRAALHRPHRAPSDAASDCLMEPIPDRIESPGIGDEARGRSIGRDCFGYFWVTSPHMTLCGVKSRLATETAAIRPKHSLSSAAFR
jgi:hypothetical protein